MKISMVRAWFIGFLMLVGVYGLWVLFLQIEKVSENLFLLMHVTPFAAALVSAFLAPRNKVFLGVSLAIPWTLLGVVLNTIYQLLGKAVDFPGIRGGLILFTLTLTYSAIAGAMGAIGGYFLAKMTNQDSDR